MAAWEPVAAALGIGKDVVGTAALTAISAAYLPNVVIGAASLLVGGEAHLGQASYSVFAVSRGPMPEVPLAAVLPTTTPHWAVQGLLLVTVVLAAALARSVAHWFRTTGDAVKAAWLAAAIVALVIAVSPVVAGGELGVLGTVGTGSLIAAGMGLLLFGIIGSATIALSLAGLTRRRERAESELERRRRRAGTVSDDVIAPVGVGGDDDAREGDDDEVDHLGADTDHSEGAAADLDGAPETDTAVDADPPSDAAAEDPPVADEPAGEQAGEPVDEPTGKPSEEPAEEVAGDAAEPAEDDSTGLPDEEPRPAD